MYIKYVDHSLAYCRKQFTLEGKMCAIFESYFHDLKLHLEWSKIINNQLK